LRICSSTLHDYETAEHAAVAEHAPAEIRGSAFGALAVQSIGNFAASAIAGLLWTTISARAAFIYLSAWMLLALFMLAISARNNARV
jgi:MFS family permease